MNRIVLFAVSLFIASWGLLNLPVPLGHLLAEQFHVSLQAMRFSVTLFFVVFSVSQFFWGVLSDYLGRRNTLRIGFVFSLLGVSATALSGSYHEYLLAQSLTALGAGSCPGLVRSILSDVLKDKALARAMVWASVTIAVTPACSAWFSVQMSQYFSWHIVFVFAALGLLLMMFLLHFWFKETSQHFIPSLHPRTWGGSFLYCMTTRQFVVGALLFALPGAVLLGAYYPIAPTLLMTDLSLSHQAYAYCILWPGLCYVGGSLMAKQWLKRWSMQRILKVGMALQLLALALMLGLLAAFGLQLWSLMLFIGLEAFAVSVMAPIAIASSMSALERHRGMGGAINSTLVAVFSALYTALLSSFSQHLMMPLLVVLFLVLLLSYFISRAWQG